MLSWLALPSWLRLLAPFLVMGSLWISSSVSPSPRTPNLLRSLLHNGAHVIAFAILAGTLLLAHPSRRLVTPVDGQHDVALRSVLLAGAYGVVDELHQAFVPGRVSSFGDLLADASGAALAVVAILPVLRSDPRPRRLVRWCGAACVASVGIATWLPW